MMISWNFYEISIYTNEPQSMKPTEKYKKKQRPKQAVPKPCIYLQTKTISPADIIQLMTIDIL